MTSADGEPDRHTEFTLLYIMFCSHSEVNRLNRSCWLPMGGTAVLRGGALLLLLMKWDNPFACKCSHIHSVPLSPAFVRQGHEVHTEGHVNTLWVQTKRTRYCTVGYGDDLNFLLWRCNGLQHVCSQEIFFSLFFSASCSFITICLAVTVYLIVYFEFKSQVKVMMADFFPPFLFQW